MVTEMDRARSQFIEMTGREFRAICRAGKWGEGHEHSIGVCRGHVAACVTILPKEYAFDFFLFCHRNPRPLYVIDVTEVGSPHPMFLAPEADVRTDCPKYRVYEHGELIDEPLEVTKYWRHDFVTFLTACAAGAGWELKAANVLFRHGGTYTSSIETVPAGPFHGPVVVSSRVFKNSQDLIRACQITSRMLISHGPPIHIGDPAIIGINDFCNPDVWNIDEGSVAPIEPDEIVAFWACGITIDRAVIGAKLPIMIVHHPGCVLIGDRLSTECAVF